MSDLQYKLKLCAHSLDIDPTGQSLNQKKYDHPTRGERG